MFVNMAKAFDSVAHKHLQRVLALAGVDRSFRAVVGSCYRGAYTTIRAADGQTKKIFIRRGVKQGDPLSPLLFNLALDPLLYTLDHKGHGLSIKGQDGTFHKLTAMAFADDLVLVSGTWDGMAQNLAILEAFLGCTGLQVNPTKTQGIYIGRQGPRYTINDCPAWEMNGEALGMVGSEDRVRYLGVELSPQKGILKPAIRDTLAGMLRRIGSAPLKPRQKVSLLKVYALPRLIYVADHGKVPKAILDVCDRDARAHLKAWLHLDQSTTNGLAYARPRDGGLGLPKLASVVLATQVRYLLLLLIALLSQLTLLL